MMSDSKAFVFLFFTSRLSKALGSFVQKTLILEMEDTLNFT